MCDKLKKITPAILLIILTCTIGCKHEYPPFDGYEVVGFTPIDSVHHGLLFVNDGRLFALYDTTGTYYQWSLLREYDLQDPTSPTLQSTESLSFPPSLTFRYFQENLVFFTQAYYDLLIFNLNTLETHNIYLGYYVQDIAFKDHFLLVTSYDGLRVLDLSNLPEYVEVFNDSIYRYGAFLYLRDTVLLDMHKFNDYYRAKIWNVREPDNPEIIYEDELPNVHTVRDVSMTDEYVILFGEYAIQRYRHDMYDTLLYEEDFYINYSPSEKKTSDSLIYLSYAGRIEVIGIDDFESEQITISDDWYHQILSFEIYDERIYVLVKNQGIYTLQRRAS